jgi:hypothetical protein
MSDVDVLARFRAAFSNSQQSDVGLVRAREARRQEIFAGAFPSIAELMCGYPLSAADIARDAALWASTEALKPYAKNTADLVRQLQAVVDNPCRWTLLAVDDAILAYPEHTRRHYYLALLGDESSRWLTVQELLSRSRKNWLDQLMGVTLAFQIARLRYVSENDADDVPPHIAQGIDHLSMMPIYDLEIERYRTALDGVDNAEREQHAADSNAVLGTIQDLVEGADTASPEASPQLVPSGVVVVPAFEIPKPKSVAEQRAMMGGRRAVREAFSDIAGVSLPLITRGDVGAHRAALNARSPHLGAVIDTILSDLAVTDTVRFRPTILVGEPGAGKSALARDICRQIGLPATVFGAGGTADGMFAGLSAGYSTAGVSVPLAHVKDRGVANPCVIIDEIDKAGTGRHNGSLVDALLGFLDRGNATVTRDPALEMTVDLSHVNWILTANSLSDVPAPLRDRCRIVNVPNPGWEHVGDLSRSIIADLAKERDLHPDWIAPLDGDELHIVRKAWNGGSIRKLRRVIEVLVDGREMIMARC